MIFPLLFDGAGVVLLIVRIVGGKPRCLAVLEMVVMGWKCVPQATGLLMHDPEPSKKTGKPPRHRHNGLGWCLECMEERASRSATLDRTRTVTNDYHGLVSSAREFWKDFETEIDEEHRTVIHRKDGSTVSRAFRKDGVPLVGVIFNPPDEVSDAWDDTTYQKFIDDSMAVMESFEPRLFSRSHVRVHVTHRDEGGTHDHVAYDTFSEDGKCNGNLLDAKRLHDLCAFYPQAMRELGWTDMDDLDLTDWKRMQADAEYAVERREKLRQQRLDTNAYIRKDNQRKAIEALQLSLEANAETAMILHEQEAERVRHEAKLDAMQEHARIVFELQKEAYERDLDVMARRTSAAVRDMENALEQVRMVKTENARLRIEAEAAEKRRTLANSEADVAEARRNEANETARKTSEELFRHQQRLLTQKEELEHLEYDFEVRSAELDELAHSFDFGSVAYDLLEYAERRAGGRFRAAFDFVRSLVPNWSKSRHDEPLATRSERCNLDTIVSDYKIPARNRCTHRQYDYGTHL